MAKEFFPISDYKKIESWLKRYFCFTPEMFFDEFILIPRLYRVENLSEDEKELKKVMLIERVEDIPKKETNCPDRFQDYIYPFALKNGKYLLLDYGSYEIDKIQSIFSLKTKKKDKDYFVIQTLKFVAAIYHKYITTEGYFHKYNRIMDSNYRDFVDKTMPEFIKLYKYLHSESSKKTLTIIQATGESVDLINNNEWFMEMTIPFIYKYLVPDFIKKMYEVPGFYITSTRREDMDEVIRSYIEDLEKGYKTKRGRPENTDFNWMLMGTHKLLTHSSFLKKGKKFTTNEAQMICKYIKLLGITGDSPVSFAYKNMEATIGRLTKREYKPIIEKEFNLLLWGDRPIEELYEKSLLQQIKELCSI